MAGSVETVELVAMATRLALPAVVPVDLAVEMAVKAVPVVQLRLVPVAVVAVRAVL